MTTVESKAKTGGSQLPVRSYAAPGVPRDRLLPAPSLLGLLRDRTGEIGITIVNLGTFFAVWEFVARMGLLPAIFVPAPSQVMQALWQMAGDGELWHHGSNSIRNLVLGFALAVAAGVPIGLAAGTWRLFNTLIAPYYWSLNSMPRLAIWPLLVLWGGFSEWIKVLLIFMSAIMPIMITTMYGVSTVDPTLIRVGRVLNATRIQLYTKIVVPFTLPFILAGLTQGMSRGLVALIVSEMLGSGRGIGYVIVRSVEEFNPAKVFAMLLLLIAIALTLVNGMGALRNRITPWQTDVKIR